MDIVIKKEMIDDLLLTNDEHTIRRNISDYVLVQHQLLSKQQQVKVGAEVKVQTVEEELNYIAKRLAALSGMPYYWEDILDRLHHGYQLPFKFEK